MNARQKLSLLSRLRQNKIPENKIDKLFNLPEKELDRLFNISNKDLFINEVSKKLNKNKERYGFYLDELKQIKNMFSKEDYDEAVILIKKSAHNFNAKFIYITLKNELLQKNNLHLVGARIIFMAKRELNAEYAHRILCISKFIELGIAIPMAELIVGTENREECLNIIKNILNEEDNLQQVSDIITRVTMNLRKNLKNMSGNEKDTIAILNIFNEILNKPFIVAPVKEEKKRIRKNNN